MKTPRGGFARSWRRIVAASLWFWHRRAKIRPLPVRYAMQTIAPGRRSG